MNDGFSFDFPIACSEFFRVSWVNRWWSPSEVQPNLTTFNNKIRSCTWAKWTYIWRLLSSCRAPLWVRGQPSFRGKQFIHNPMFTSYRQYSPLVMFITYVSEPELTFTRYRFTLRLLCGSQSFLYRPLPVHCPHCCNTIARLLRKIRRPPRPLLCMLYTIQYW